ncbi:MAG: DUF2062 domain-containing protein [Deltaproteobacteria bacterium]|jgi:uncharacterized protein (DUF2062 family)|nr:DUF2062 domain-containing protein [Deltaproteobacteria bacterium]MBW2450698.1 DUF2062 domain-containing protein [Deltaproteobacteria bacterium]
MKDTKQDSNIKTSPGRFHRHSISDFIDRVKNLEGDPHYIAMGMAIGVFIGITPTMPFHTVLAVGLAIILRGSKAAAALGVWFCNPITAPIFYWGSYKAGMYLLGNPAPFDVKYESILELLDLGMDVTIAMIMGGVILGILPGIASYFITRKIITTLRLRKASKG